MAEERSEPFHRTVSANDVPPVGRSGSPFDVLSAYGGAPAGKSERPEPEQPPRTRGKRSAKKANAPRVTRANGAQFKVACVLLTAGAAGMHQDDIAAQLEGVPPKALTVALRNMKSQGRVERQHGTPQRWALTEAGRDWTTGGSNLMEHRRARSVTTVAHPQLVPVRASFRCWVASDGTFSMEKAGQKIELALEETRQMLRYLDAVGEQLVADAQGGA